MLSGDRLQFLRIIHNITEKDMAECIGKSDRWVRKIESGEETPTDEVYKAWINTCYGKIKPDGRKKKKAETK